MNQKNKIVLILIAILVGGTVAGTYAIMQSYVTISSSGRIAVTYTAVGKLSPGNKAAGQNPTLFYDDNGQVVILRMVQASATEPFFTWTFPNTAYSYGEAQIELLNQSAANTHRLHVFPISGDGNEYSEVRRVPNQALYNELIDFCSTAAARGQYYVLDGYIDNITISVNTNNWFFKELSSPGGLIWNTTVRDDFVWLWSETLTQLWNAGEDVWNHLAYIDPWSEFEGGSSAQDIKAICRNPYLFDGKHGLGNAALLDWQAWLRQKYQNNINNLKSAWSVGNTERWNWNGAENDSFSSIGYSQGAFATESIRQIDMQMWYNEAIANFTRYCSEYWKSYFPGVLVSWGGYGADISMGYGGAISPSEQPFNTASELIYTDVIDQHWYGSDSAQDFTHWDSDYIKYGFAHLAAVARALEKPIVVGETGVVTGQNLGFSSSERENTYAWWNRTAQDMIKYGWAGWCPYWYGYYYALEAAGNAVSETNIRLPVMKYNNELYAGSGQYMATAPFDPITIISTYGEKFREYRGLEGIFQLFITAGYNPKYVILPWDEKTNLPDGIPSDTSVVVLGSGYTSFTMSEHTCQLIRNWANNNSSRKIIALYAQERSIYNTSIRWENTLNASWFPISPMTYGTTYVSGDFAHSSTNIHVNIDGTSVLIDRSTSWSGGYYVDWDYTKITGQWLINTTDGRYYSGIGYEPLVIANSKLAWVMSPLDQSCACLGTFRMYSPNSGLIIEKIMEHFGFSPV